MFDLKSALNQGNDAQIMMSIVDVKALATQARGSKTRIRFATRVLALCESAEGDKQIAKWIRQKAAESTLKGLWDVVEDHAEVDRFCPLLGELLLEGVAGDMWLYCVQTLLLMRPPEALGFVLEAAEQSVHGSPGTVNLLARGGKLDHEAIRVKRYLERWKGTRHFDSATHLWILAKLGEAPAYQELVQLCLHGTMDANNAMRAAQALSHIHQWAVPWGEEGTEIVREKLRNEAIAETAE